MITSPSIKVAALLSMSVLALSACTTPSDSPSAPADTSSTASAAESTAAADDASPSASTDVANASQSDGPVTVTNCGEELMLPKQATKMYVNDGNIISLALAVGAADEITAVSSLQRDKAVLKQKFGDVVDGLNVVAEKYPTLESIIAADPDLMVAGWNYGFSEGNNLTPDILKEKDIPSYILTESCRQEGTTKRGIIDPWEAVRVDLNNLGTITGHSDTAKTVVDDLDMRLKKLDDAAKPEKTPVVFLFDSAKDTIFSSGSFGAPNAIIKTAGGVNATEDVEDTWTTVTWEKLAANEPDVFAFVEYPGQTYDEKIQILKTHPITKDMAAVKEERFVNLPYALWTESPMNIDAAEYLRKALEQYNLAPASDITPQLDMPADMPGLDKLPKK
ncbi:ABC transporter substrate-binding protein [Stomatohabitans albus]|uniref:ABC transporter substrate-binding protein n=1 Tax=Stomatohabitans albus TaxID=3110766 RepID=UPI00300D0554